MVPILIMVIYNLSITMQLSDSSLFSSMFKSRNAADFNKTVDIISVGSVLKEAFQDGQQLAFGSHQVVRDFYRITEMSDSDRNCFNDLTMDQIDDIIQFCGDTEGQSSISTMFREILFTPKKHAGWICAQKRPIDGLYQVVQKYRNNEKTIPDYLFIIDDDTYLNMDSITQVLRVQYPPTAHNLLAGCNFDFLNSRNFFTFPYGGFGSFIPKVSIERMLKPVRCLKNFKDDEQTDPFQRLACWRLERNEVGEQRFFKNGMSVVDLMYEYASQQPFADVANWKSGYCFHR